jgi:hypothetical protein
MQKYWILKAIKFICIASLAVFLFAYVVMLLWNCLIPSIFGISSITFWQAAGLLLLSRLLFGTFHRCGGGGHKRHGYWKNKMKEKYKNMTPEEKERFKEKFGRYCNPSCDDDPESESASY